MSTIPLMGAGTTGTGSAGATKFVILNPTDGIVGSAVTVTVQAQKADNTVDTSYQIGVTLNTSGNFATGGGLVTITNGVGTLNITDNTLETINLTLTDSQGTGLDCSSTQDLAFTGPFGNDNNVIMAANFDGANGATTGTTEAMGLTGARTLTFGGNAQYSSTSPWGGSTSLLCDGTGDYVSFPDTANLVFYNGDMTIEMYVNPTTLPANNVSYEIYSQIITGGIAVGMINPSNVPGLRMNLSDGVSLTMNYDANVTISTGTWTHIAIVRNSNSWQWYVAGIAIGAAFTGTNSSKTDWPNFTSASFIGCYPDTISNPYNGRIDSIRISNVARYTSNFTPPNGEWSA